MCIYFCVACTKNIELNVMGKSAVESHMKCRKHMGKPLRKTENLSQSVFCL